MRQNEFFLPRTVEDQVRLTHGPIALLAS